MDITTIEFQKFILFEVTKIPDSDNPEKGLCFLEVKIAKLKKDSEKQYSNDDFNIGDIEFIPLKTAKTHFDVLFADKTKLGLPLDQKTVLEYVAELYDKGFLRKTNLYPNGLLKDENEISNDLIENFLNKKENEDKPVRFKISNFSLEIKTLESLEEYVKQHRNAIIESLITKLEFERRYKESNIILSDIDLELFFKTLSFKYPIESAFHVLADKNNKERTFIIANFELIVNKEKLKNIIKNDLSQLNDNEIKLKSESTYDLFKKFNEGLFKWIITHFLQMYRFDNKLDLSSLGLLCDITTQKSDNMLFQIVNEIFFNGKDKIEKYNNKFIFLCEAKVLVFMPYIFNKAIKEALTDFASSENSKSQKFLKDFAEQERLALPLRLNEKKYNEDLFNELDDIKSVVEIFSESSLKEIYNEIVEKEKFKYNKCYPHQLNELPCEGNYNELLNVFISHNIRDIIKNDLKYNLKIGKKENDEIVEDIKKNHITTLNTSSTFKNVSLKIPQEKQIIDTDEFLNKEAIVRFEENTPYLPQKIVDEMKQNTQEIPQEKQIIDTDEFLDKINIIKTKEEFPYLSSEIVGEIEQKIVEASLEEQINNPTLTIYKDEIIDEEPFGEFNADRMEEFNEVEADLGEFVRENLEIKSNQEIRLNGINEPIYKDEEELNVLKNKLNEKDNIIKELKAQIKLLENDEQIKNIENNYLKLSDSLKAEIKNKNDDIKKLRQAVAEKNISLENTKQKLESIKCEIEELKSLSNNNLESVKIDFVSFSELYLNIPLNENEYSKTIFLLSLLSCASKSDAEILNNYIDFALEKNSLNIDKLTEEYSSFLKKLDIEDKRGLERALKTAKSDVRAGLLSMLDFFKDCFEYNEIKTKTNKSKQHENISGLEKQKEAVLADESNKTSTKNNGSLLNKILSKFDFKNKNKKISNGRHVSLIFDVLIDKPYFSKNIINAVTEEISNIIADVLMKNKITFQNLSVNTPVLKEQKEEEIKKKCFISLKYEILIIVYEDNLIYERFNNIFQKELKKLRFEAVFVESIFHS